MKARYKSRHTLPANKVVKRPVEWLWEKHVPVGMVSIVAGAPEKGKSMWTARVAADVSQDAAVIVSTYEDPIAEVAAPRMEAAGARMENVHFWKHGIRMPQDGGYLREEIEKLGVALVIMDPASAHTRYSIYNATAIRDAFGSLEAIAEDTGCAFVFVHHIVKKVDLNADPLNAVGGSGGGLGALARAVYLFGDSPDDPDERCLVQLKCNIAGKRPGLKFEMDVAELGDGVDAGYLELRGQHTYSPQVIFTAKATASEAKYEMVAEYLVENLREGALSIQALLDGAVERGFTKRMTRNVALLLELRQTKSLKWRLPKEFPA